MSEHNDAPTCGLMTASQTGGPGSEVTFDMFEFFDKSTYESISRAQVRLRQFVNADLLPYVEYSYFQFRTACEDLENKLKLQAQFIPFVTVMRFPLSCYLLTVLSSIVMFYENTSRKIDHMYGAGSPEVQTLRGFFTDAYDDSFGYRFCYRLRQYVTHKSFEVLNISASSTVAPLPSGLMVPTHSLEIFVKRDELLEVTDVWSQVRPEIQERPERILMPPLVDDAIEQVRRISRRSRKLLVPEVEQDLAILKDTRAKFVGRQGAPAIFEISDPQAFTHPEGTHSMPQVALDFSLVDKAETILRESATAD